MGQPIICDDIFLTRVFIIMVHDAPGTCSQRILSCSVMIFVYSVTVFVPSLIFSIGVTVLRFYRVKIAMNTLSNFLSSEQFQFIWTVDEYLLKSRNARR